MIFTREHAMRKVLRGYAKDKTGNLILIGTMPVPHSKDSGKTSCEQKRCSRHSINFHIDGLLVTLAPLFAFKPGRDAIQKHYQGIIDAGATSVTLNLRDVGEETAH